jgi:hypothetical protein
MIKTVFAAALLAGLLGANTAGAVPAPKVSGERCDQYGCWTMQCDANSNHCHRHWITDRDRAGPARFTPPVDAQTHKQSVCDPNGDNCR